MNFEIILHSGLATGTVLLFATIGVTMVLHGVGMTTVPLFLDGVFGVAASVRGLVIATFQLGVILTAVQIGRLRARHSGTKLVGSAFLLMAAGMLVVAVAPEWWFVSVGMAISGFGFGLYIGIRTDADRLRCE